VKNPEIQGEKSSFQEGRDEQNQIQGEKSSFLRNSRWKIQFFKEFKVEIQGENSR
jgi:hypothetical protein